VNNNKFSVVEYAYHWQTAGDETDVEQSIIKLFRYYSMKSRIDGSYVYLMNTKKIGSVL
jgi:hypothetical protein